MEKENHLKQTFMTWGVFHDVFSTNLTSEADTETFPTSNECVILPEN